MASHSHDQAALPEPKTPMWLSALGVAMLFFGAVYWASLPTSDVTADTTTAAPAAKAAPSPQAQPARPNPRGAIPNGGMPPGHPSGIQPNNAPKPLAVPPNPHH